MEHLEETLTPGKLSGISIAPEMTVRGESYDEKVDIWSFGALVSRLFPKDKSNEKDIPSEILNNGTKYYHDDFKEDKAEALSFYSPQKKEPRDLQPFWELTRDCLNFAPKKRPCFAEIVDRIEAWPEKVSIQEREWPEGFCTKFKE